MPEDVRRCRLASKVGLVDPVWEAARRTMCRAETRKRCYGPRRRSAAVRDGRGRVRSIGQLAIAPDPAEWQQRDLGIPDRHEACAPESALPSRTCAATPSAAHGQRHGAERLRKYWPLPRSSPPRLGPSLPPSSALPSIKHGICHSPPPKTVHARLYRISFARCPGGGSYRLRNSYWRTVRRCCRM